MVRPRLFPDFDRSSLGLFNFYANPHAHIVFFGLQVEIIEI